MIAPVFAPLGFGTREASGSLLTGFVAKEVVIVAQSFETSSGGHGRLAGLAFMVFVLLYMLCVVAVAAERQEFGAKRPA